MYPISKSFALGYYNLLFGSVHYLQVFFLDKKMSGVWVFKNGVVRLVENPGVESLDRSRQGCSTRSKVLVHTPSNEVITSYAVLERKLWSLGWERYYDDPDLLQFHKRSTVHLISLPKDFNKFKSIHMYDIVVKNRNVFEVRDM
ncbi:flowering-promoting factor 1-like protein 3 [Hibiscus syriacus]|nr:flowering-promoting factor 1-like protein 3 [Hibiscus syriacus]